MLRKYSRLQGYNGCVSWNMYMYIMHGCQDYDFYKICCESANTSCYSLYNNMLYSLTTCHEMGARVHTCTYLQVLNLSGKVETS